MNPNNIKKYRQLSEMTQEELAEQIGITRQTLMRYESGQSIKMKPEIIQRISDILKVSIESLLDESPLPMKEIRKIPIATDYSDCEWVIEGYIDLLFDDEDKGDYVIFKCSSNDLYPDIKVGETILFRKSSEVSDGQLVLIYNHELDQVGMRYLVIDDNGQTPILLAIDRKIRPIIYHNNPKWEIVGVGVYMVNKSSRIYGSMLS